MLTARERTVAVLLLSAAAMLLSFRGIYEPDLFWHLAQGRENAAGRLVRTNLFGVPAAYPQPYTSWLWDLATYVAMRTGGAAGVQASQAATLLICFSALYVACRRRAGVAAAAVATLLAIVVVEPRALPRPHLASFAGMAIVSLVVARAGATRSARPLVWLVPLTALWSNLHLEVVFGVALVGMFAVGEWLRPTALPRREAVRAAVITVACVAALLANPYGPGLLRYLIENASVPSMVSIAELQPPYLPAYRGYYAWVVLLGALCLLRPREVAIWEVAAAGLFAALGFRYLRLTPLLALATAPLVARQLATWIPAPLDARAVLVTGCAAAVALVRVPLPAWPGEWRFGGDALQPAPFVSAGAVRFAEDAGLDGPAFTSFNAGGYVAWTLYPRVATFQDSRLQAWPPGWFGAILRSAASQDDWNALVRDLHWAFIARRSANQLSGVDRFPDAEWALVYWDDAAEVRVQRRGRLAGSAAGELHVVRPEADIFALAGRLSSEDGAVIRREARMLARYDPRRLAPAVILCADGEPAACEHLEALARTYPAVAARAAQILAANRRR